VVEFPNAPQADGQTVGKVDVVFGAAEHSRNRSISGSTVEGFGVPCDTGCGHIELSGNSVLGRQWDSGKYQEVRGGLGTLGSVNGERNQRDGIRLGKRSSLYYGMFLSLKLQPRWRCSFVSALVVHRIWAVLPTLWELCH
jgi:hypothetical protein